jgi:uncharacterized protein
VSGPLLIDGRAPLAGYGRGWFRVGSIEHRGSLLILPGGVYGWPVVDAAGITEAGLAPVLAEGSAAGFLLLGTGAVQVFPDRALRAAFTTAGLGLEAMDTGAACRTYNVLLSEGRVFAAALIALP